MSYWTCHYRYVYIAMFLWVFSSERQHVSSSVATKRSGIAVRA